MVEILKAILFGIIEGVTEWLPISSTGHMILLNEFITLDVSKEFYSMFEVVIQLGAILAVVVLYWNSIWPFGLKLKEPVKETGLLKYFDKPKWIMWIKVLVACVPAAIVGLAFNDLFEELFYNYVCVAIALIVFGVAFIIIETRNHCKSAKINSIAELDYKTVIIIGLFQLIAAIFPGTSRSGATIVGALLIGVSRVVAAEFTFYLAVPVMFGASLLKLVKFGFAFTTLEFFILMVGMIVAFITSMFVISFLMSYIKKHDFKVFGYYRIVLGILVLAYYFLFAIK